MCTRCWRNCHRMINVWKRISRRRVYWLSRFLVKVVSRICGDAKITMRTSSTKRLPIFISPESNILKRITKLRNRAMCSAQNCFQIVSQGLLVSSFLFYDAFSATRWQGDMRKMMNWKGFGRKRSWPNFKVLSRHSPGRTEENHENNQDSWLSGPTFEPRTSRIRSRSVSHWTMTFGWTTN
jgi:hypothetical protein